MGRVQCSKHGMAGIIETCAHVAEDLDRSLLGDFTQVAILGKLLLCPACMQAGGFKKFAAKLEDWQSLLAKENDELWTEYVAQYERVPGRRIYCSEYVATAMVDSARKRGLPDPFKVYENTVNSNQSDITTEIGQLLNSRYTFPVSIIDKRQSSMRVVPGNYRLPLIVKFYYIEDQETQDGIVGLLYNYFCGSPLYQICIEFWQAEVWTTWKNERTGTSGRSKGEELLLRKVYMNCSQS